MYSTLPCHPDPGCQCCFLALRSCLSPQLPCAEGENICFEVLGAAHPLMTPRVALPHRVRRAQFSSLVPEDLRQAMQAPRG